MADWYRSALAVANSPHTRTHVTGGPGCSSELALLFENGAWTVDANLTLVPNPFSWNKIANVLYIDSPAGTGYSYVTNPDGYVTNEREVADNIYTVLQAFFSMHPEYAPNAFFVFCESYGGHYCPAVSERILKGNKKRASVDINFQARIDGCVLVGCSLSDLRARRLAGPGHWQRHDDAADAIRRVRAL